MSCGRGRGALSRASAFDMPIAECYLGDGGEGAMARRVLFTIIALVLATSAFYSADSTPDVNLFGVLFLFFAFIFLFCWHEIQAGYSYLEDAGVPRYETSGLMFLRFAPIYLRELTAKKRRRP